MSDKQNDSPADSPQKPEEVVEAAAVDSEEPPPPSDKQGKKAPPIERPYPRRPLEDAWKVPTAIRQHNNGNPWPPGEIAKSFGISTGASFFYMTQASREFGLTTGGRDSKFISLTDLGRKAVFPNVPGDLEQAKLDAFNNVKVFRDVALHYGGSNLPDDEFVKNTLQTQFGLDPRVHDEFLDLFKKNCRFAGIGADWKGTATTTKPNKAALLPVSATTVVPVGPSAEEHDGEQPTCFVIMPFVEHTDMYATGFFTEVFASLFAPAIEAAGFKPKTARRQGSDLIQATIINELLDSELVLCDLTEHNPNVLFELGVRMALERPIALVKAIGTNPIFDVDQMLRVESYNPNLWPSTVQVDVPKLSAHINEAYATRNNQRSYMSILRQVATPVNPG